MTKDKVVVELPKMRVVATKASRTLENKFLLFGSLLCAESSTRRWAVESAVQVVGKGAPGKQVMVSQCTVFRKCIP